MKPMSSYWDILRNRSACVHFIYAEDLDESDQGFLSELTRSGIIHAYVDFMEVKRDGQHVANAVAGLLKLDNAPYPTQESIKIWVPFTDDLITLSENAKGVAIIVDNADAYLHENSREMFEFIEDFLLQFYHWFEKKKPCHLCFQMEKSDWVKRIFGADPPLLR